MGTLFFKNLKNFLQIVPAKIKKKKKVYLMSNICIFKTLEMAQCVFMNSWNAGPREM